MSNRFNRDYKLIITTPNQTITIQPPIHISFQAEKSINTFGLNRLNLQVFNLSEGKRNQLVKDAEETKTIKVELFAGYVGNIKKIFQGQVHKAYPDRNGANLVSYLECIDGLLDVKNSFTSANATTKKQAIQIIVSNMPNTEIGKITEPNKIYRNKIIMGNSYEEIKKLLQPDELMYIDDDKLYIIKDTEVSDKYAPLINSDTGLIGVPRRENQIVEIETLMNPSIKIGGSARLESIYAPYLNGNYRVESSSFKGGYDGQEWNMSLKLKQLKE